MDSRQQPPNHFNDSRHTAEVLRNVHDPGNISEEKKPSGPCELIASFLNPRGTSFFQIAREEAGDQGRE